MSNYNPNDTSYERKEVINYLIDSGVDPDKASAKVANMTDAQVLRFIDCIPEEGHEDQEEN
jgi:hypothetical protein